MVSEERAMEKHLAGVPAVRLASRIQLTTTFFPSSSRRGNRRGSSADGHPPPPPALMADVRIVIRRHFPVGPDNRIVEKVAEDIAFRRQLSRKLRRPDCVERTLAADVLPIVQHPFDRDAVVAAMKEICTYVSLACCDPRLAEGGVQVLVLLDTRACPTLLRPPPCMQIRSIGPAKHVDVVMDLGSTVAAKKQRPVGTIGDARPKPATEEIRLTGWLPW